MILELRLLSSSTGQPHPLAKQPVIFIDKGTLPLHTWSFKIEIVGDFITLFVSFPEWNTNQDLFFLVRWKTGQTHCVSVFVVTATLSAIADSLCSARVPRKGNLQTFQLPLARYPCDS